MENNDRPIQKAGRTIRKWFRILIVIALLAGGIFFYWKYYYPFLSDGVKSGYLNFVGYKGYIFKTYEGKLIQEGIKSRTAGAIQSNEFEFSMTKKSIYEQLKLNSGKIFVLQYKEYNGALPWRGNSKYIVDSIISIKDPN